MTGAGWVFVAMLLPVQGEGLITGWVKPQPSQQVCEAVRKEVIAEFGKSGSSAHMLVTQCTKR